MPWKISDVDKHHAGLTDKQKKQWVEVANSVLDRCKKNGGTDETCAPSAIKQASRVVNNNALQLSDNVGTENYSITERTHQGKTYEVVPVIMLVQGVLKGSQGPLLHTVEEFGRIPSSWNGRPVVVGHPKDEDGNFVSANSPDIVDNKTVGTVYNSYIDGNRLKGEVWLDKEKLATISPEVVSILAKNEILEVSVGVFTENEPVSGDWSGVQYDAIARNHRPDHLALLPGGIGACSVEAGCGIRVNSLIEEKKGENDVEVNAIVTDMEAKRKELGLSPTDFYAVPRDPPSSSKLPIFDATHVRNALARFDQTDGLTPEEKAAAKSKILAKAKKLGIDTSKTTNNALKEAMQDLMKDFSLNEIETYASVNLKEHLGHLRDLVSRMDSPNQSHYLEDAYADDAGGGSLVYSQISQGAEDKMFQRAYKNVEGGKPEFTGDAKEVKKQVSYKKVNNNELVRTKFKKEVDVMANEKCTPCIEKKVTALIANTATKFEESDRTWLEALEESVLDRMVPEVPAPVVVNTAPVLSPEDKAALDYGKKQLAQKKAELKANIQANTAKGLWTDEILNNMDDSMLERIYASVPKPEPEVYNYAGMGGGGSVVANVAGNKTEALYPAGIEVK